MSIEFFPLTDLFTRRAGEQKLENPITQGYVAVGNLGKQGKSDEVILGCKSRTVENCKRCVTLGIARQISCTKPKT